MSDAQTPREPSADMRRMARNLRDMYDALLAEGFTAKQALDIIGATLAAAFGKSGPDA